jgi:hypothetical protein
MNKQVKKFCMGLVLASISHVSHASLALVFDQSSYHVEPGQTFSVTVSLDADDSISELQALADGLFSYGLAVNFDASAISLLNVSNISVPSELNFSGFNAGAAKSLSNGKAGVKGNINQSLFIPYAGTTLATFTFTDLGTKSSYQLSSAIFRTLGDSEEVFLDGIGNELDDDLTLNSVTVSSVPVPAAGYLLGSGLMSLCFLGRNRKRLTGKKD